MKNNFLNLPKNIFKMKANLYKNELIYLNEWCNLNIYDYINFFKSKKQIFYLHDGPPYANGPIHIGHALNKTLKDFIAKSQRLSGFYTEFIVGWDCHGLPIELKIKNCHNNNNFKKLCNQYALKQIELQKTNLHRLGILTNWKRYYYTSNYIYESNIIKTLIEIIKNDYLLFDNKPVNWCLKCNSTLSDSELIFKNIYIKSVYCAFTISNYFNIEKLFSIFKLSYSTISIIIFVEKPFIIPLINHIYFNVDIYYFLIKIKNQLYIIKETYFNKIINIFKINQFSIEGKCKGKYIKNIYLYNIFYKKNIIILHNENNKSDYSSNYLDYKEFNQFKTKNSSILCNLDNQGNYIFKFKFYQLSTIFNSFEKIKNCFLKNNCFFQEVMCYVKHEFCWRHQVPSFYRIKQQWFINLTTTNIKTKIINKINNLNWKINNRLNLIVSLINERPDWCISRQRKWGVPITIFIHKKTKKVHPNTLNFMKIIADKVKIYGTNLWDKLKISDFIKFDHLNYEKVTDVLDVWFDSGSSIFTYKNQFNTNHQCNLVIEGNDQYRGWFMSSVILSIIINNKLPFKEILSHGFVLDKNRNKMSKSLGNVISPQDIIIKFGADILRIWIALNNYQNDIIISTNYIDYSTKIYKKIRNTFRFLLSNISIKDFNYMNNEIIFFDYWILNKIKLIQDKIIFNYHKYNFKNVIEIIYNFCQFELSNIYFELIKNRLYLCNKQDVNRISCISTIINIINHMVRWIFPIISFTSYEIWKYLPYNKFSLFYNVWYTQSIKINSNLVNINIWNNIFYLRNRIIGFIDKIKIFTLNKNCSNMTIYLLLDTNSFYLLNYLNKEKKFLFPNNTIKTFLFTKYHNKIKIFYIKNLFKKCYRCLKQYRYLNCNFCNLCKKDLFKKYEKKYFI